LWPIIAAVEASLPSTFATHDNAYSLAMADVRSLKAGVSYSYFFTNAALRYFLLTKLHGHYAISKACLIFAGLGTVSPVKALTALQCVCRTLFSVRSVKDIP